ncbi:DUF6049 family protein [Cellulosimicrobium funkei]|uniref:DUF6049 family protein n=1 Tax=Cellulosimicrobium funkei TaxID=264251 RepID=UPI00203A9893|nr:DUF6049 family protein [Cellulosimicrobium funkei]MCM3535011.1 DUF6049 family protein [Cellulosimicrobium funkei]
MTPSSRSGARPPGAAPASLRGPTARLLVTLLLVLVVAAGVLLGGTTAAPPAAADTVPEGEDAVTLELTSFAPTVLAPDSTLTVTARVTNGTEQTLDSPTVTLGVDRRALRTRSALESWTTTGLDGRVGTTVATEDVGRPLAPGESADVTLSAPAAELGLGTGNDPGPRGLAVAVSDGGTRLAVQRTFALRAPADDVSPVRLSVVAALTGPPVDPDPVAYDDALSAAVASEGRLGRLLAATGGTSDVGWVADPALLAAAAVAADPAVNAWADAVSGATAGRSTFALRAYDPDVAAFAHAGLALPEGTPLPSSGTSSDPASGTAADDTTDGTTDGDDDAADTGTPAPPDPTNGWRTDLAWPADAVPDLATTTLAVASGATATVVGPGGLAPADSLTYTPSGVATVTTSAGPATALVADPVLTALLSAGDGSGVSATQRLLAETAVIARERPADQRHVLAALPRSWEPEPGLFTARLDALRDSGWVDLAPVDQLLAVEPPAVDRASLPEDASADGEIGAAELRSLDRSRAELAAFATVAADPTALMRPLEPAFVTPTAVAYRAAPPSRTLAVQQAEQRSAAVRGGLSVETRSSFFFVAEQEDLPVRVRSTLTQDATVQVVLRPDDPRLRAPERTTVTIPAATRDADGDLVPTEASVGVPVEGFGSGNVTVEVELVSAAQPQVRVAEPQQFVVRVRADWESVGTVVVAVLLVIALFAGIWRTVRRGRSPRRLAGATLDQPSPQDPPAAAPSGPDGPPRRDEERVE